MTPSTPTILLPLVLERRDDQRGAGQREQLVLRADEDVHALAAFGEAQQLDQVALGLEVVEQLADALQVLQRRRRP